MIDSFALVAKTLHMSLHQMRKKFVFASFFQINIVYIVNDFMHAPVPFQLRSKQIFTHYLRHYRFEWVYNALSQWQ